MPSLRDLLGGRLPVVAPGAFNAFTARMIETAGFPAVYIGGNSLGITNCVPEPLTGLSELLDMARSVAGAVDLPIIADADAGFGDEPHVFNTVRRCAAAGIAAIHIEDQPYPKNPSYHGGNFRTTDTEPMLRKLRVANEGRAGSDLLLIGRSDLYRVTRSLDTLMERFAAYTEVGVDMLLAPGVPPELAAEFAARTRALPGAPPVAWIAGSGEREFTTAELGDMGFALVVYPTTLWAATFAALTPVLNSIREQGLSGIPGEAIANARRGIFQTMELDRLVSFESAQVN